MRNNNEARTDIYDLKINESLDLGEIGYCTRVPGGWVYTFFPHDGTGIASTFVEFTASMY